MTVEAIGHWSGDPDKFTGQLHVTAKTQTEAEDLAAVYRLLRDHPAGLKILTAAAAEEAELSALAD